MGKGIRKICIIPLNLPLFKPGAGSLRKGEIGHGFFATLRMTGKFSCIFGFWLFDVVQNLDIRI
jgi:hypothetical protein